MRKESRFRIGSAIPCNDQFRLIDGHLSVNIGMPVCELFHPRNFAKISMASEMS